MLFVLGFQLIPGASTNGPATMPTEASENFPRLLALESTDLPPQATSTPVPITLTPKLESTLVVATVRSSRTPLVLLHDQQPDIIGYSFEGRPLAVYTFGTGEHQRMIVADIHGGDEWNTLTLANQLIKYLNQQADTVPSDVTLYILPSLNPDGESRAHDKYGRLNHSGVDLNRNFPVNWQADWNRAGCWNYLPSSGGASPGSEVETQALMGFINNHRIEALISYHSAALGIFPGGDPPDKHSAQLAEAIGEVSNYRYPPLDTGCTYSGTLADYAASKGVAAVDLELTNHFDTDFQQNLDILNVLLNFEP
jgi:predicted deacylase